MGHEAFKPRALSIPSQCGSYLFAPKLSPDCCVDSCKGYDTSLARHVFVLSRHVPGVAYESFEAECKPLTPDTQCCNYFLLFPLLFWKIYTIILFWWLFDYNSILKYKKYNIIWYFYLLGKWKVHKTFFFLLGGGTGHKML